MNKTRLFWLIPLSLFILIAPFTPWLDMAIEEYFYSIGSSRYDHFFSNAYFNWMYDYGTLPALALFSAATVALPLSCLIPSLAYLKKPALLLFLTMAIGAGALTHLFLKDHWGRPRPKQVIAFGGKQEFRPFWSPHFGGEKEPSKSFPCGHCTMGFYFFAPALAARRAGRRGLSTLFYVVAFGLGISLSLARMAQGGHFFSDTLTAALIMWLTALFLDRLLSNQSLR